MKILVLITARGGSKRLPGKNIRILGGKPLIKWSIEVAKDIPEVCDILVSTDDPKISAVCKEAGAYVPWLRPAMLATDNANSVDVALHALDWYEAEKGEVDGLLLLQPTSPFRSHNTVLRGIKLFCEQHPPSVIGVSPAASHPMWCFKIKNSIMSSFIEEGLNLRSQELPPAYVINGAFYLISPSELRQHRSFYNNTTMPLMMDKFEESIDIDTEWDWRIAEAVILTEHKNENK